jgi:hypothetical protein
MKKLAIMVICLWCGAWLLTAPIGTQARPFASPIMTLPFESPLATPDVSVVGTPSSRDVTPTPEAVRAATAPANWRTAVQAAIIVVRMPYVWNVRR